MVFIFPSGTKVEGILRQSADVEEVDSRVQEYEQGRVRLKIVIFLNAFDELWNFCTLVEDSSLIYFPLFLKFSHAL